MSETETRSPPMPRKMRAIVDRTPDQMLLACRVRQWGGGCFLLLWLTGWTVGCVFLAVQLIREPQLFHFMFAIPFWASWVFVFFLVAKMFLQTEVVLLDRDGLHFARRVVVRTNEKNVPLEEVKQFNRYSAVVDSESRRTESGIEAITLGRSIKFLQSLPADELDYLQYELNDQLRALTSPSQRAARAQPTPETMAVESTPVEPGSPLILMPKDKVPVVAGPSDSAWRRVDDYSNVRFLRKGRFAPGAFFVLLFINLFWNGIVSVFVAGLWGLAPGANHGMPAFGSGGWWGLFVFLIPFEVIGLAMMAVMAAALFEPVHRTMWTFSTDDIQLRHAWLGLGFRRAWAIDHLDRIELVAEDEKTRKQLFRTGRATDSGSMSYRLTVIDADNREVCRIAALSEGEARWIGLTLVHERAKWFR